LSLRNYGHVLYQTDRGEEALAVFREAYERSARVRKEDDPEHINAMSDYATGLQKTGELAESEALYKRVLELRRRVQGNDHPMTIQALDIYGLALERLGRNEEAAICEEQALEQRRRVLGNNHPQTLESLNHCADTLRVLGRHDEAEPLAAELYQKAGQVQVSPQKAAGYLAVYGPCLVRVGKYEQAEAPLREAYRRLVETRQTSGGPMRRVLEGLVALCEHANRSDEAEQWRQQLRAIPPPASKPTTQHSLAATTTRASS
jgi:tetratricopeptide (TPR) repeat protein